MSAFGNSTHIIPYPGTSQGPELFFMRIKMRQYLALGWDWFLCGLLWVYNGL